MDICSFSTIVCSIYVYICIVIPCYPNEISKYQTNNIQCLRDGIIWGWVKTLYPCGSLENSWDLWMFIPIHTLYLYIYIMYIIYIYIYLGIVSIAKKDRKGKSYFNRDKSLLYLSRDTVHSQYALDEANAWGTRNWRTVAQSSSWALAVNISGLW